MARSRRRRRSRTLRTGAAVGAYMDYQDAKLREFLAGTGVRVVRVGDEITLSMPSNITFQTGSDVLSQDFLDVMHGVSLVLVEYERARGSTACVSWPRDSAKTTRSRATIRPTVER